MCGRTRCSLREGQVERVAGASRWVGREQYRPSFNVAPGAPTPVVRVGSDGEVTVQTMRWGLVPSFTKKDEKPDFYRMFNARSESVAEKNSFRRLVPTRRCLVLAEGFYEWYKEKGEQKQPYYIHLAPTSSENGDASKAGTSGSGTGGSSEAGGEMQEEEPLVMAGLWDVWDGPEGPMHTYTILTTDSSKRLEWLHDRMPVILRTREAQQAWLQTQGEAVGKLLHLCVPYNGEDLVWHPVTRQMNTPSFQGPECCKEVKKPKPQDFFKPRSSGAGAAAAAAAAAASKTKSELAADGGSSRQKEQQGQQQAAATGRKRVQGMKEEQAGSAIKVEMKDEEGAGAAGQQGEQRPEQLQSGLPPAAPAAATAVNADEQPGDRQQAAAAAAAGEQAAAAAAAGAYSSKDKQQKEQRQHSSSTPKASPAAAQKRKQAAGSGGASGKKGSAGSAAKTGRPAGQPDISKFFSAKS